MVYGGVSIKKMGLYEEILQVLMEGKINVIHQPGIELNPRYTSVNSGIKICKEEKIDLILALGGGSVIDVAKLMALGTFYDSNI